MHTWRLWLKFDEARRLHRRLRGGAETSSIPSYLDLGCNSTEAVREVEDLETSRDVFLFNCQKLLDVLRNVTVKTLPLVPDSRFGSDHVTKTCGPKEAPQGHP